jgi:hypothetical protein
MKYLILTTLPHYVAMIPVWNYLLLRQYCYTIAASTTLSILYHAYHESNKVIMWLDYLMALIWFLSDVSWGLVMTPYSFFLLLILNALVFLANQSISHDDRYPARHSFWHLFSACKCICISVLISHSMQQYPSKDLSPIHNNMAFVQAMNSLKLGVNGADVYTETGVGDDRVTLFTMLNRGLEAEYIQDHVDKIHAKHDAKWMQDLWVMAFQTRDIRGGKGERKLFYELIEALHRVHPAETERMLSLVPEYGCWRDLWEIWQRIPALELPILELVKKTHFEDVNIMRLKKNESQNGMSLLGKWLPREKSKTFPGLAKKIAQFIFRSEVVPNKQMMYYRSICSEMNRVLKTVELDMCRKTWSSIVPEAVPGRCLKIHDKAFLNEPSKKQKVSENELRYPNDTDRMECRAHFQEFVEGLKAGTKKAHGANVVLPHELVVKTEDYTTSSDQHAIIQAQWDAIREETVKGGGLGKSVAMCDFSGSMHGIPMEISRALGILISEITHPTFRDHILTFDASPQWHSFVGKKTLKAKLESIRGCGQGLNTDFYKACHLIISRMVQNKVPVGEEPEDLIVITDMGFDEASSPRSSSSTLSAWETQLVRIRRDFKEAGERLWGKGCSWMPPRIVIWNVRAAFKDFHAKADQEGVVQLSGWAPSMLKALQTGGVKVQTPYEGMRSILDDERYDAVRALYTL